MKITVNDEQRLLSEMAVGKAESRAAASFAKFSDHVKSVAITIRDVNGPKGGVDKQCQVLVRLKKFNDIVVTASHETISKAIPGAIDRAARSVGRVLDRSMRNAKTSRYGLNL